MSCPKCQDESIHARERAPGLLVWIAEGWRDDDGLDVEIDFCPFCGELLADKLVEPQTVHSD